MTELFCHSPSLHPTTAIGPATPSSP